LTKPVLGSLVIRLVAVVLVFGLVPHTLTAKALLGDWGMGEPSTATSGFWRTIPASTVATAIAVHTLRGKGATAEYNRYEHTVALLRSLIVGHEFLLFLSPLRVPPALPPKVVFYLSHE
jgi:hypothetical protein